MAFLSISQAAIQTGKSRSTIFRAIKNGRLSARKKDTGEFEIDAAELFRVYPPTKGKPLHAQRPQQFTQQETQHDATAVETAIKMAELEIEIRMLKQLLDEVKSSRDEMKQDRDEWKGRFERLLTDQRNVPQNSQKTESMSEILKRMKEKAKTAN